MGIVRSRPRRLVLGLAAALGASCAASSQPGGAPDPMLQRFADFWRPVTVGPTAIGGSSAAVTWQRRDATQCGSSRIARLGPQALTAAVAEMGALSEPESVNGRPASRGLMPNRNGLVLTWLHDEWRVEVGLEPGSAAGADAQANVLEDVVEVATRLDRVLSGQPALPPIASETQPLSVGSSPVGVAESAQPDSAIVVCREASGNQPVGVAEAFDRADKLSAVVNLATVAAAAPLQIAWKRGNETLVQYDLPTMRGPNLIAVQLDMTGVGGFAPGAYEVQLLSGGQVVALRRFTVGDTGGAPPEATGAEPVAPGVVAGSPAGPTVTDLRLGEALDANLRPVVSASRFAATVPRIHVSFYYSGFPPGTTLAVDWGPPRGTPPITTAIPLEYERGVAACSIGPPPGGALATGKWSLTVRLQDAATPLFFRRFTVE